MRRPIVERLREKPKEVRVQVAFLTALCVTGIVGLAWGATLPMRLDNAPNIENVIVEREEKSFGEMFASARSNVAQLIGAGGDAEEVPKENTSASGAYTVGAPEGTKPQETYQIQAPATVVEPVSRREVLISTSTRRTNE